jgi:hypothetical protein
MRSVKKPAFCAPPDIVGDRFGFEPMALIVFLAPYRGMSGEPMAALPGARPVEVCGVRAK